MIVGFDLDGVLDRASMRDLAVSLLKGGHEVHIITGQFSEAGDWQSTKAKFSKLSRLGISFMYGPCVVGVTDGVPAARLHILDAADPSFGSDYRLRDLGLRKGALCEELGVEMFFDDSQLYCDLIRAYSGDTIVLQVR